MSDIAKRDYRKVNVNSKAPKFITTKLTDKSGCTRWHVECVNREVLGVQGVKNIKEGVAFKFCRDLKDANKYMEIVAKLVETIK